MVFRTTFQNTLRTPLPPDLEVKELVSLLHDHSFLITMNQLVTRHKERESDQTTGKITYDIWEKINVLPFGLWKHGLQYTVVFTDKQDGVVNYVEAPMGFTQQLTYVVKPNIGEEGSFVLEETIQTSCSAIFKAFVEATMLPEHKKMHQRLIEETRTRR